MFPLYLPYELVDIIADYHDYNKYCKPKHEKLFRVVVGDINLLGNLLKPIKPHTVWNNWGPPAQRRAHRGFIRNLPYQAYSLATVAQSLNYQIFVSVTILVLIFINYKIFKNLYGFLAVGAGIIVIFGFLFDQSFLRYLGNFFVFYLYFLIKEGNSISIRLTCLAYFPFFCLSTYYSVINLI